ncbi:MAG: apolipoprotein N-acyltransferase, partial [Spirochaetia bacterium]|nr:apolipoprotein N-acyltransferase [Spirochaetia bacterium]
VLLNLFGYLLLQKWSKLQPIAKKTVLVIQPDAPLEFRDGRSFRESMHDLMTRIERLVDQGAKAKKPDLIVIPESGVPFFSAHYSQATTSYNPSYWKDFEAMIKLFALKYRANVFFNEIDAGFQNDIQNEENQVFYNNSALYDPNGERRDFYRKSFLLVFGEYMPFEFMYMLSPQTAKFEPGKIQNLIPFYAVENKEIGKAALSWNDTAKMDLSNLHDYYGKAAIKTAGSFLPLICYEVIIPEFVRKFRNNGNPGFIVNITNDKWYGKSVETYQHFDLARIRAIEHRRWMVRSTNSGTSAIVDHLGQVVNNKMTGLETAEYIISDISVIDSEETFYVKHGNLIPWLLILLVAFGAYFTKKQEN